MSHFERVRENAKDHVKGNTKVVHLARNTFPYCNPYHSLMPCIVVEDPITCKKCLAASKKEKK